MLYSRYLKSLKQCPFCPPVKDRIIKSNTHAYLTYAIAPYHKHHMLVIPRKHVGSLLDITPSLARSIEELERHGLKILEKLGYHNRAALLARDGDLRGHSVRHIHFHVIPNVRLGDTDHRGKKRYILTPSEIKKLLKDFSL